MDNAELFEAVTLLVDKTAANEINKKGLAEIAFRRADQKFRSMIKYRVLNSCDESTGQKILEAALGQSDANSHAISQLQHVIKNVDLSAKKLASMDGKVDKIAAVMDSFQFQFPKLAKLSFLNAGISLANIAVDVKGFLIINESINGLSNELSSLKSELSSLKQLNFDADISRPAQELKVRYGFFCDWLKTGKTIPISDLEDYLERINPYLSSIINLLDNESLDRESILNYVFTLFPVYASVLSMYLKAFFNENRCAPTNYDQFLSVFEQLNASHLHDIVLDQFFLPGKYTYEETVHILGCSSLALFSERLQIDDLLVLLETYYEDEMFSKFDEGLTELAEDRISKEVVNISERSGVPLEECRRILGVSQQ